MIYKTLEPWSGPIQSPAHPQPAPRASSAGPDPTSPGYWLDAEFMQAFSEALVDPWARDYFQVSVEGLEKIPSARPAMLTLNHSGMGWPWDAILFIHLLAKTHGYERAWLARGFALPFFFTVPGLQQLVLRVGLFPATGANLNRLADERELILYFPEGLVGIAKGWKRRYQMQKCHTSFVRTAVRTGAPVVPVACLGAEELNPYAVNLEALAKAVGLPLFPLSPVQLALFPAWLTSAVFALPVPIRYVVGQPLRFTLDPRTATEDDYQQAAEEYRQVLQELITSNRPPDAPTRRAIRGGVRLLGKAADLLRSPPALPRAPEAWCWTAEDRLLAATPFGWPLLYLRFWNRWHETHARKEDGPEWQAYPLDRSSELALLVPWLWGLPALRHASTLKTDRLQIRKSLLR